MRHITVGTAGHIDHGKSALVRALTGKDPDRLKEERERGITTDIGFADLKLGDDLHVGFVDVPGHERFVKNMLAGVAGIDAVMLVVAATESLMPQTREHFDICKLLNVSAGLVAVTKIDLADSDLVELVLLEVEEFVQNSFLQDAPVIPVSSVTGQGLPEIRAALAGLADKIRPKDCGSVFRLPVDRCFTLPGMGTIVTGTLTSGVIQTEAKVQIYPTSKIGHVRNIQVHGHRVDRAAAGQRTALNLQNVAVGEIDRGMQLSVADRFQPVMTYDAEIRLLMTSPIAIKRRTPVRLHCGTSELMAVVSPIGNNVIQPGDTAFARITLEQPVLAIVGDQFILRRTSPMVTIGGGVVLHVQLPDGGKRRPSTSFLAALDVNSPKEIIFQLARRNGTTGITEEQILAQTLMGTEQMREAARGLAAENRLRLFSSSPCHAMETGSFTRLCKESLKVVEEYYHREAITAGLPKEHLYSALFADSPKGVFKAVLATLSMEASILVEEDLVKLPGMLTPQDALAKQQIEDAFLQAGWKAPSMEEVIARLSLPEGHVRRLVSLLVKEKALVKVSEDLIYHAEMVCRLKVVLADFKNTSKTIGVGDLKQLANISRKYAVPLLDYCDREKVTRRVGDRHLIQ